MECGMVDDRRTVGNVFFYSKEACSWPALKDRELQNKIRTTLAVRIVSVR
jgi:hypothetical protein